MPQGQVIARKGQIGTLAGTLVPNIYLKIPFFWEWTKFPVTEIGENEVGVVEAIDGESLPKGRTFADEPAIDTNHFQDGEAFLLNHGKKGVQIPVLTVGKYRINPVLFRVTKYPATIIGTEQTGIVTAQDGQPLPSDLRIAPDPDGTKNYQSYQNGQAFIDSKGFKGVQREPLQTGKYFLNPLLFTVTPVPITEVPTGFVAVLRSNVGKEKAKVVTPLSEDAMVKAEESVEAANAEIENVIVSDKTERGIYATPLATGKYNLNTTAYTPFNVPTSAIMVDWASADTVTSATMSSGGRTVQKSSSADIPYNDASIAQTYRFDQLQVFSKDGFPINVSVRMIIRIPQENAAFVIARFGTPFNLIQQIVHPLIESSFRISAGNSKALDFYQNRGTLQQTSFDQAKKVFAEYKIIAQSLLLNNIEFADKNGQNLLDTQNQKEIALQQQTQYQEQAKAQEQRIDVETKKATADKQPDVVSSQLSITIEQNKANALIETAKGTKQKSIIESEGTQQATINKATGDRQATILTSEGTKTRLENEGSGEATKVKAVGEAQGQAYEAQKQALGQNTIGIIQVMEKIAEGKVKIVPDTLVQGSGSGDSATGSLFQLLLLQLVKDGKAKVDDDGSVSLTKTSTDPVTSTANTMSSMLSRKPAGTA